MSEPYSFDRLRQELKQYKIPFSEELHPGLRHEFPDDFEKSFEDALKFIFKE